MVVKVKAHKRKAYTRRHPITGRLIRVNPAKVKSYDRRPTFRLIRASGDAVFLKASLVAGGGRIRELFEKAYKEGKLHLSEQKNYYRLSVTKDWFAKNAMRVDGLWADFGTVDIGAEGHAKIVVGKLKSDVKKYGRGRASTITHALLLDKKDWILEDSKLKPVSIRGRLEYADFDLLIPHRWKTMGNIPKKD